MNCIDFVWIIFHPVIDFVLYDYLTSPAPAGNFDSHSQNCGCMKKKEPRQNDQSGSNSPDLDSVKELLKLKALQTTILKKIIEPNEPSDNNECLTKNPKNEK